MGAALVVGVGFFGKAAAEKIPAVTRVSTVTRISFFTILS